MNTEISINDSPLKIKEYKGQRVVTFKDIDKVHDRAAGTAKRNFNRNIDKFVEYQDFFRVKPSDVQRYEIRTSEINNAGTILLTEMGYLMLVKSFTDDLAWSVQRSLVNNYFRVKNEVQITNKTEQLKVKTYKGKPVLTIHDIQEVTGIPGININYHLKSNQRFLNGSDYDLIKGNDLKQFKLENITIKSMVNAIYVLYQSGIEKLYHSMAAFGEEDCKKLLECFVSQKTIQDVIKRQYEKIMEAQELLNSAKKLLEPCCTNLLPEPYPLDGFKKAMIEFGAVLCRKCSKVEILKSRDEFLCFLSSAFSGEQKKNIIDFVDRFYLKVLSMADRLKNEKLLIKSKILYL